MYPVELAQRSVIVYLQAPDEDLAKATPGFELVLNTLTVEDD